MILVISTAGISFVLTFCTVSSTQLSSLSPCRGCGAGTNKLINTECLVGCVVITQAPCVSIFNFELVWKFQFEKFELLISNDTSKIQKLRTFEISIWLENPNSIFNFEHSKIELVRKFWFQTTLHLKFQNFEMFEKIESKSIKDLIHYWASQYPLFRKLVSIV